jgi:hypothetical protein
MILEITNFSELLLKYSNNFTKIISEVLNLADLTMFEHFGEIIHVDFNRIVIVWDKKIIKERQSEQEDMENPYRIFFVDHEKIGRKFVTLATISAIKLLGRLNHEFNEVKMNISINKGTLHYILINSSNKIDVAINSQVLREAKRNLKLAQKYSLQIIMTSKIYQKLNEELQPYCRIIPERETTIYTYDLSYEKNTFPFKDDSILKSEHAFMERKKHAILLNKVKFDIVKVIRTNPELLALRPSNSKIFIKYYQIAFKRFLHKREIEGLEYLDEALKHRPKDNLCLKLKFNMKKNSRVSVRINNLTKDIKLTE